MKHIHTFESFLNESTHITTDQIQEIASQLAADAKEDKLTRAEYMEWVKSEDVKAYIQDMCENKYKIQNFNIDDVVSSVVGFASRLY